MKIVTTWSALEILGPAYTWPTEVYFLGEFDGRKLDGNLALKGYGDPYLVVEELWKLLRALRRLGARGDQRRPRARRRLLRRERRARARRVRRPAVSHLQRRAERAADELQGREVSVPRRSGARARERRDRPRARRTSRSATTSSSSTARAAATRPASRSTTPTRRPLGRGRARRQVLAPLQRLLAEPHGAAARHVRVRPVSRRSGRRSAGSSRASSRKVVVPEGETPALVWRSRPLGEVVRSINKNSNNVMTRQLVYTLGAEIGGAPGHAREGHRGDPRVSRVARSRRELARAAERRRAVARRARVGRAARRRAARGVSEPVRARVHRVAVARRSRRHDARPLRRHSGESLMHVKTGRLDHVSALAGYVHAANDKTYVVAVVMNSDDGASRARAGARGGRRALGAVATVGTSRATRGRRHSETPRPAPRPSSNRQASRRGRRRTHSVGLESYSALSVSIGSIVAARRAGR